MDDLTGIKFGRWVVVRRVLSTSKGKTRWLCRCDCGAEGEVNGWFLRSGKSKSCGCYNREVATARARKVWSPIDYGDHYGILLGKGHEAFIDISDYDKVKGSSWTFSAPGYAVCTIRRRNYLLHRFILDVSDPNIEIDHIDHNPLNNRRRNLRLCRHSENLKNRVLSSNNTSGFQGVYRDKRRGEWYSRIIVDDKYIHLGRFISKEEAIEARKKAELMYFGEYSILNQRG